MRCSGSGSSGTTTSRRKTNPAFSYARIALVFIMDGPITHSATSYRANTTSRRKARMSAGPWPLPMRSGSPMKRSIPADGASSASARPYSS